MISQLARTFCISENCENKCGRKLTEEVKKLASEKRYYLSVGDFCTIKTGIKNAINNRSNHSL